MKKLLMMLWPVTTLASQLPPTAFPVFLKAGFSSVLEFDEAPVRVVLGDGQSFQVERVDRSVVVRTLTQYAASNMFVYFKDSQPRLFVLTASEDANPTYYKKFDKEAPIRITPVLQKARNESVSKSDSETGYDLRITRTEFDFKKDYLTIEGELSSASQEILKPNWKLLRLTYKSRALAPFKLWSERETVQKDSTVKFRVILAKPNVPRDLKGVSIVIPVLGQLHAINVSLGRSK